MTLLIWRHSSHGPAGRTLTRICNLHDRLQFGGYTTLAFTKNALASQVDLLDMFAAI
jgi:hypothetical protein